MKPIVTTPNPILTAQAKTVTSFDKKLAILIARMKETLLATKNPKGVGLAAPQIGESWRVFLTKPTDKSNIRVFINPTITSSSSAKTDGVPERTNKLEGCLSIPKLWGYVHRHASLTLHYTDEQGSKHDESFSGFMATIVQHETDHLHGILYVQRVLEQKGKMYQSTTDEDGKEVLEEVTLS